MRAFEHKHVRAMVAFVGAGLTLLCCGAHAQGSAAASWVESLTSGKASVALRYRFESVSDDGFGGRDAKASTLRTALGYRTQEYRHLSFFVEAENVAVIGDDDYNNAGAGARFNGVRDRPVVADAALTELNQAYLRWENGATEATVGRQEILLGDLRFVGSVAWRQNHQSFDALKIVHGGVEDWTLSYVFADAVHRIFGDSQDLAGHFVNARYDWANVGVLTLYGYLLDYDDRPAASLSSSTLGAELSGKRKVSDGWSLLYEIEAAQQDDAGDNPNRLDAGYRHVSFGGSRTGAGDLTLRVGLEILEGNARDGQFRTPLATLHKFNGWADKFLATPVDGLEDLYLMVSGKTPGGLDWTARYHEFGATEGDAAYGSEVDFELAYRTSWNQTFALTAALYDADNFARDTDKFMLWTGYGF